MKVIWNRPREVLPQQDPVEVHLVETEQIVEITQHYTNGADSRTIFISKMNLQRFIDALVDLAEQT